MSSKRGFSLLPIFICIWGILVFAITEGLSLFMSLTKWRVRICWVVIGVITIVIVTYLFVKKKWWNCIKQKFINRNFVTNNKMDIVFWCIIVILMVPIYYLARNVVPNNYDSMVYHLPRIMNWMQNRTVDYYPTNSCRQVISPVLTEYAQMHFYWLLGGDYYFSLVQFFAYVINAVLLGQICKKINMGRTATYLTIVLYLSMPVCLAEAITTQVDLFGTMWLLVFIDIVVDLIKIPHFEIKSYGTLVPLFGCASAVGLGFLTKSNVCFCMVPFLVWLLISRLRAKDRLKDLLILIILAGVIVLAFVLPTFVRNYLYWGDILAASYSSTLSTGTLNPVMLFLNTYKNWAINAGTSWGQYGLASVGYFLAGLFGKDINDPLITWGGRRLEDITYGSYHHDTATNPLFSYLLPIAIVLSVVYVLRKRNSSDDKFRRTMGISLIGALLLCYAFVRAQQFGTRLIMPGSILGCMFIGIVFEEIVTRLRLNGVKIANITAIVLMLFSLGLAVPVYLYQTEYLNYDENSDRFEKYFAMDIWSYAPYFASCMVVERIGVKDIGIYVMGDPYQYPIWARFPMEEGYRVTEVVDVPEDSYNADFRILPECIMTFKNLDDATEREYEYMGYKYICVFTNYVDDAILLREDLIDSNIDYKHLLDDM